MENDVLPELSALEAWFVTGSQFLYGNEALRAVEDHSREMVQVLAKEAGLPVHLVFKEVVLDPEGILNICQKANAEKRCIGLIAWMHTFSPGKMWIGGLKILRKPLLHLHTQFNRDIPWQEIDMDFMNLNQSAHGDREFGFMLTRMRLSRKVVVGHWRDRHVWERLQVWMRAAAAWHDWQGARFCRFGDNMRQVAVTEGDKVEAEIRLGYSVNGFGVGDLVAVMKDISESDIDALLAEYEERYTLVPSLQKSGEKRASLRESARIELALRTFLREGTFKGFTNTFEDLHGMPQLPGIAVQRLMASGYGFGAEGDWKTAALVRAMKVMGRGLKGGNSFMEDYTYHFHPSNPLVLGSHMLEICESIAEDRPSCEIHPLGIGGKPDPVRLVFQAGAGPALNASIIDMGNRFRLLVNTVEAVQTEWDLPLLPVARVLWKPDPDLQTGCAAWILAGGAHHTGFSQNLTVEHMEDFAEMAGIEFVPIDKDTRLFPFKSMLRMNDFCYRYNPT